jgi:NAD(P)H-dependent FMN reductase
MPQVIIMVALMVAGGISAWAQLRGSVSELQAHIAKAHLYVSPETLDGRYMDRDVAMDKLTALDKRMERLETKVDRLLELRMRERNQ